MSAQDLSANSKKLVLQSLQDLDTLQFSLNLDREHLRELNRTTLGKKDKALTQALLMNTIHLMELVALSTAISQLPRELQKLVFHAAQIDIHSLYSRIDLDLARTDAGGE